MTQYGLRKRRRTNSNPDALEGGSDALKRLHQWAATSQRMVVFSGSGLSVNCGMSTFSTPGGLYERAQRRFRLPNGKKLFTYSFFEKHRADAHAFFADIHGEAQRAYPGLGHQALARIAALGKLQRHYSMNIDGLSEKVGLSTWHVKDNPTGLTVEIHGNINQLVCPDCGVVCQLTPEQLKQLRGKRAIPCGACSCQAVRCRIMLYDDADDDVITPEDVFDVMEEDLKAADLVLWVGISFEQSASTAYFRRARGYLDAAGRLHDCRQALINTSEDAFWNLMSSCSNKGSLEVTEVLGSSDDILPSLAAAMAAAGPVARPIPTAGAPAAAAVSVATDGDATAVAAVVVSGVQPPALVAAPETRLRPDAPSLEQRSAAAGNGHEPPPSSRSSHPRNEAVQSEPLGRADAAADAAEAHECRPELPVK